MSSADNIPDRLGLFYDIRGDNLPKIEIVDKSKLDLCHDFIVRREDHTVGNLVRNRLLMDPYVIFAAYKHPHPLETEIRFRVRTYNQQPIKSFSTALALVRKEVSEFREAFCKATGYVDKYETNISSAGEGPAGAYDSFGDFGPGNDFTNDATFDTWGSGDQSFGNNDFYGGDTTAAEFNDTNNYGDW